jgi:asparagine synthase (glutamine-hydrolysing)
MCGIAGYNGSFEPSILRLFGAAMSHRGPDDAGEWLSQDGHIGLAHRRLSIIDVSSLAHQPMVDDTEQAVVAFNGEIYNFRELRDDLAKKGHRFRSHSDTEVLLALYRTHGEDMLPLLNGIFAFAIYDRATDSLLLACDDCAVKPIYVSESPRGVVFASELKALVAGNAVGSRLETTAVFRTLGFLWNPGGATLLKDVWRMGPGEAARIKRGQIVRRWTWAQSTWTTDSARVDVVEATRMVQDAVRTAVHRQLVSDVPVGAFLSGGLDSSAIVAMAREVTPRIECFTIDTGGTSDAGVADDLPYARQAARHLSVPLHEVRVGAERMAGDLERMVHQLDEPLADPSSLNVLYISQLARQTGTKVLLSGVGGDDVFSGYRRHHALSLERVWNHLPTQARASLRRMSLWLDQSNPSARRVAKALAYAHASPERRLCGYFLWADAETLRELFTPEHRAVLTDVAIDEPLQVFLTTLPAGLPPLQRMLALEQRFFLADHNLLYTDKMGMSTGVEIRVPFLDKDLVRLANSLPTRLKQRGGTGKWILRQAMAPLLPREIVNRPKTGFGAPLRRWLRHELTELVDDSLSPDALRKRGLFEPRAVRKLIEDDRAGRTDAVYTILALMCIEIWCRHFLDAYRGVDLDVPRCSAATA